MEGDAQPAGLFQQLVQTASTTAGGHVAVVDGDSCLTYQELVRASAAFCEALAAAGVKPRDRVGVILGNQKEFLIAAFGAWKHGAVLAPLNPQLRETELAACILDSSVRAIATTSRNGRMVGVVRARGAPIEHAWLCSPGVDGWTYEGAAVSDPGARADKVSEAAIGPGWPALTQYSTGSTGHPRRVTRTHGQLIGELRSVALLLRVTPADRVLGAAPFFHSYGLIVSALLTLLSGGALYAVDTFLPGNIARLIEREKLSGLPGVPFMFQLLAGHTAHRDLSSLRFALSAGAPLASATAASFESRYGKKIRRLYGSTETGVISISDEADGAGAVNSVGLPIPGVSVEIVDGCGRAATVGEEGLVRVSSEFAASTYDGSAAGGESYFTDNGFVPGDLGRIGPTGELSLHGRRRSFINVNGYKVDPSEVETILLELPGVTEAVVLGISDGAGGERVKAILVARTGGSPRAVRAHCVRRLAAFKCPQIIEFRSELPRNRLGKVLRKYLLDEFPPPAPP